MKRLLVILAVTSISGCAEVKQTYTRCNQATEHLSRAMGEPTEITEQNGDTWYWYDDQAVVVAMSALPREGTVPDYQLCNQNATTYKKVVDINHHSQYTK